jgi:hypothetical protein
MHGAHAGVEAELLGLVDVFLGRAGALAVLDEGLQGLGLFSAAALASGWSGAIAMNLAPNSVSGRVV